MSYRQIKRKEKGLSYISRKLDIRTTSTINKN